MPVEVALFIIKNTADIARLAIGGQKLTRAGGLQVRHWVGFCVLAVDASIFWSHRVIAEDVFATRLSFRDTRAFPRASPEVNRKIVYTHEDGTISPYLELPFRADLLRNTHHEFGHIGFPGLNSVVRPRG
ncbi:uncharacterized protein N7518_006592 [Penicillium psychrosexuale]|uniref:uncharacterized protein n=1 Tax=Penicillium psychrosexuale TaxID=1002107 RepID=UPI0025453AA6|nr:uncharacterized protein N7518_006592 [Penicillium psychrosexuale]KAJ5789581.1 hypothetical protein N7518_006592 [Penicillium psychrosexuale]